MDKPEIQDYIGDVVRKANDSSIQALTNLIKDIQEQQKDHREEELRSRLIYRDDMLMAVEKKIEAIVPKVVNGKIDKLTNTVDEMRKDLKEHVDVVQPIIESFNDKKGFWKTITAGGMKTGAVVGILAGGAVIFGYLLKLYGQG